MKLPPYIYIVPQAGLEGAGLIESTMPPYCLGKVVKFRKELDYITFLKRHNMPVGKVKGYRVCILYAGTINDMSEGIGDFKLMQTLLDDMAEWYYDNRIKNEQPKFINLLRKGAGLFLSLIFFRSIN